MAVQAARGMRDYLPEAMALRGWAFDAVVRVFEAFGFERLETPAVERLDTLLGKYGEEGDQLLFRILKRGEGGDRGEADLGLRYDLTVPLARVVAQHSAALPMPFKRYQIQPVWRADRPQRGRFREFVQCDVDVVGTTSLAADAELVAVAERAFRGLGLGDACLRVNHRQVLRSLVGAAGVPADREGDALVAIDKLDKVGPEGVLAELEARGLAAAAPRIQDLLVARNEAPLSGVDVVAAFIGHDEAGQRGLAELRELVARIDDYGLPGAAWRVDPVLARGLSYYTGPVFEAELPGFSGSVAGGGRYDGLVGMFLGRDVPATGLSLGIERLLVILEERGAAAARRTVVDVGIALFDEGSRAPALAVAGALRDAGFRVDVPLEDRKLKKQLKAFADRGVPLVVVQGPDERARGEVQLKDLRTGAQEAVATGALPAAVRARLEGSATVG